MANYRIKMNSSINNLKVKSHLLMIIFSALISGSFILGSIVANEIDPSTISAVRFLLAFIILFLVLKLSKKQVKFLFVKFWRYIVLGGLIATYFVMMFEGLKTASSISMSATMTLTPFLAVILEYIVFRKVVERTILLALLMGASGSVWIIFDADLSRIASLKLGRGEALFLVGCLCQAIYTLLIPILNEGEEPLEQTSNTMLVSALILIIINFQIVKDTEWNKISLTTWTTILYLAIFATAIAFFILQFARNVLPSTYIMAYYYVVPVWVLIFEVLIFRTRFEPTIWLGSIAIISTFVVIIFKDINLHPLKNAK